MQIGIANQICPRDMHFTFLDHCSLEEYLNSGQVFQNYVTDELVFLVVVHFLVLVDFRGEGSEDVFDF